MTKTQSSGVIITVAGQTEADHQTTRYIAVRRRVRKGQSLNWQDHVYQEGAVITLKSNAAFDLERAGILEKLPGVGDA